MSEHEEAPSKMDFTKGYLPVMTVASMLFFVVWTTKTVVEAKLDTDYKFEQNHREIKAVAEATKDLATSIALRWRIWWSRDDMHYWCEKQRQAFPALICPVVSNPPYSGVLDSQEPVERVIKKLDNIGTKKEEEPPK